MESGCEPSFAMERKQTASEDGGGTRGNSPDLVCSGGDGDQCYLHPTMAEARLEADLAGAGCSSIPDVSRRGIKPLCFDARGFWIPAVCLPALRGNPAGVAAFVGAR